MRLRRLCLAIAALAAVSVVPGISQQKAPDLAGKWKGVVKADAGEMPIEVAITIEKGQATGTIKTFHGDLVIRDGAFADGKWVLPFQAGDGPRGKMTGVLKGDTLSGEWDFRPQAFGTFSITRVK